jgi:hypothetical protein
LVVEMNLEKASWFFDRIKIYLFLFVLTIFVLLNQETLSSMIASHVKEAFARALTSLILYMLIALVLVGIIGAVLRTYVSKPCEEERVNPTPTEKSKIALEEYKEGNKFSQSYVRNSWTITSIFLPVCFGLVAVSYTEPVLQLPANSMFALATASISLFLAWWAYMNRYASYNRSILKRLRELEKHPSLQMCLHRQIHEDDEARAVRWRIRHANLLMLALLLIAWIVRFKIPT